MYEIMKNNYLVKVIVGFYFFAYCKVYCSLFVYLLINCISRYKLL